MKKAYLKSLTEAKLKIPVVGSSFVDVGVGFRGPLNLNGKKFLNSRMATFRLEHSEILQHGSQLIKPFDIGPFSPGEAAGFVFEIESPEVTPETFLKRFWEGVRLAEPFIHPMTFGGLGKVQKTMAAPEGSQELQQLSQKADSIADLMLERQKNLMLDIEAAEAARETAMLRQRLFEELDRFHWKKYHSHHVLPQLSRVSAEMYNEKMNYMWELSYSSPCEPTEHRIKPFDYYSPPPVTSGYTIGPEAGGGDSGGCERGLGRRRWRFGLGSLRGFRLG